MEKIKKKITIVQSIYYFNSLKYLNKLSVTNFIIY